MCNVELQMLNAGLLQTGAQSGMRPALQGRGMQCQGEVSNTQAARRAALAQATPVAPKAKLFKPLLCLGNYSLHKL
jgi:hypothetical protein